MSKSGKRFFYISYIIFCFLFFVYYLFPADSLKKFAYARIAQAFPEEDVSLGKLSLTFPPGLSAKDFSVYRNNNSIFDADELIVYPGYLSLFTNKKKISFKCMAYEGRIDGDAKFAGTRPVLSSFTARISGIHLADILALKNVSPHNITGVVKGDIHYFMGGIQDRKSGISLVCDSLGIEFLNSFYGIESIKFKEARADLDVNNNRILVKLVTLKGDQMDGHISGSVMIRNPLERSRLNLKGGISPKSFLLNKINKRFPVSLFGKNRHNGDIGFRIGGTLGKPRYSLM